jgi:hypothetical protein
MRGRVVSGRSVPFARVNTVLSRVSFISITIGAMIDPKAMLKTHTSLEIHTHAQTHTILERD